MKNLLYILSIFTFFPVYAQDHFPCGADHKRKELILKHPEILQKEMELDQFTQGYAAEHFSSRSGQVYIVPVVFHIVHQNGPENISDAQIRDAVRILNEDFRKLNADTSQIVSGFDTLAADTRIEFRLATIDPLGNCTDGIDRVFSPETYVGDDGSKLNQWPRNKYLNIWVVNRMENGVAGYAYYPSSVDAGLMALFDGIMILHTYVGSIGTGNAFRSRALTHEVGHWLNLQHPWGNNNNPGVACGDDQVQDTPITRGWSTCNLSGSICFPGVIENVQNFMDYSYCSLMFTTGQAIRMRAALESTISGRNNLWSPQNLLETGVDPSVVQNCAPKADFYPERQLVCAGDLVRFLDNSVLGEATSWNWSFQDGNPSTSAIASPIVSFSSPGWKQVTLSVSNAYGSDTRTIQRAVYVSSSVEDYRAPYWESFEWYLPFAEKWIVNNPAGNTSAFSLYQGAGFAGMHSIRLSRQNLPPNPLFDGDQDLDELITPSFDLTGFAGTSFNFRYAYATDATLQSDISESLKIYSSTDCGATWVLRKTISGTSLVSGFGSAGAFFVPTSSSQWAYDEVLISASLAQPDVRFKFEFLSSPFSNNLFLDEINIATTTTVEEHALSPVSVYPNPAADHVIVEFSSSVPDDLTAAVFDMTGRKILSWSPVATGNAVGLDLSVLSPGVYILELNSPSFSHSVRLVKQ